jgi:hypothetical protein
VVPTLYCLDGIQALAPVIIDVVRYVTLAGGEVVNFSEIQVTCSL